MRPTPVNQYTHIHPQAHTHTHTHTHTLKVFYTPLIHIPEALALDAKNQ